jgi:uncharacterized lipoprotein YbaY
MRQNLNLSKLLGVLLASVITGSFAASMTSSAPAKTTAATAKVTVANSKVVSSATTVVVKGFSIPDDAVLTVSLLDSCWQNRENLANQKIIADYLLTQPKVPNNYEIAWKTARLVYFIGNYGIGEEKFVHTDDGVTLFNYGAQAGSLAKKLNPNSVEGYYWYAIDLGSYGLAKGIFAAARGAGPGMDALQAAMKINPNYQWYGSSRILGRYYQELPGIFGGSSSKAQDLLMSAVKKEPAFSNNWVFLGQYYLSQDNYKNALTACSNALKTGELDGKYEELRYRREAVQCVKKAKSELS